jgi:hypothetical protein
MKFYLCLAVVVFYSIGCKDGNQKDSHSAAIQIKPVLSQCSPSGVFNRKDSIGTLRGPVVAIEDTSANSATGGIQIKDQEGKSTWFSFSYSEVPNLSLKNINIGNCVEIDFRAEIIREEGVESNRIFFIKNIKILQ